MFCKKAHFRYTNWLKISEKSITRKTLLCVTCVAPNNSTGSKKIAPEFLNLSAFKLPLCGLVVFIDVNTYLLTVDSSFKIFLKKNYAIALGKR